MLRNNQSGFTLIEVIVSVVVISIILLAVINIFGDTIKVGKQMLDYQVLADELRNVTFALEKDIRQGNGVLTDPNNPGDYPECVVPGAPGVCRELKIADENGNMVWYYLDNGARLKRATSLFSPVPSDEFLTSSEIQINSLFFHVTRGIDPVSGLPTEQPRATVAIEAKVAGGVKVLKAQTTFSEKGY